MEQAEQVIADYRRAQLLGGKSAPRDVSMEDWLRYWMREIITPNCAETTRHGYENILYTHMIPTLGKVYAQELTAMRVQQYYGSCGKRALPTTPFASIMCCCMRRWGRQYGRGS